MEIETFSTDGTSPPPEELPHLIGDKFETEEAFLAATKHCPKMRVKITDPICYRRASTRFFCSDPGLSSKKGNRCSYGEQLVTAVLLDVVVIFSSQLYTSLSRMTRTRRGALRLPQRIPTQHLTPVCAGK